MKLSQGPRGPKNNAGKICLRQIRLRLRLRLR
jgi:hypothetical protein